MYAYLFPMKEEKAFFGESSYGSCSFCKGSDEKKIRDAKSENETKRKLRIVGPVILIIGGVLLICSCILWAATRSLTRSSSRSSVLSRSDQQELVHHGNRRPQQQRDIQYGGTSTHNSTSQCSTAHHQNNPYPNQNRPLREMRPTNHDKFQAYPMMQLEQPLLINDPTIEPPAFITDMTLQTPAYNPHILSSAGEHNGKFPFLANNNLVLKSYHAT